MLAALQEHPISSIPRFAEATKLTQPAVTAALERLAAAGIVREISGKRRGRIYSYEQYLGILAEGTAPLRQDLMLRVTSMISFKRLLPRSMATRLALTRYVLPSALICTALGIARAQTPADSSRQTDDVIIELTATDGTPLVGKLSIPRGSIGAAPVVFYLHGAGPRSYDHPVRYRAADGQIRTTDYYSFYARGLAREGLAFFRLAKRGCAIDSTGRLRAERAVFSAATPTVLLADYVRALEALRRRPEIDANRIVLYGASEGTRLAPQLALRAPEGIVGLVLASYQGDNQRNTVVWQNTVGPWRNVRAMFPGATDSGLRKADYDAAVARTPALGGRLPFALVDRDSSGTLTPGELEALTKPRLDAILKAVDDRNDDFLWQAVLNLSSAYLLDGWDGPPTSAMLVRLDLPVGIFHGALDGTTRVEGVRETEATFKSAGKSNLTVRVYPGLDHDLGWTPVNAERGGIPPYQDSFRFAAALARKP